MSSLVTTKHTEWTSEQDEILIDFVRSHKCLYNVQSKDYRKAQLKQSLWNEIAQILQKSDNDCKKRWGYIRDYYIKRRGKPSIGSSSEALKRRSKQLSFLDSISSVKRSTLSNIGQCESQKDGESSTAHLSNEGNSMEQEQSQIVTVDDDIHHVSDSQETEDDVKAPIAKRKCIPESTPADERLKISKQIAEKQDQRKEGNEKKDENDLFFASMAKIVKNLPKVVQARLRMQVGTLVGNAEIEHLLMASSEYRPPSAGSSTT